MIPRDAGWRSLARGPVAAGAVLLLVALLSTSASADYDETERRLKGAGIEPVLRALIHASIDRGVDRLIQCQRPDGSFTSKDLVNFYAGHPVGLAALAGLALRHAGGPKAKTAAAKAIAYVAGPFGQGKLRARERTYPAGITSMLLMADRSHPGLSADIAARFVASQSKLGWWGYSISMVQGREHARPNLSTAQFAALGLWAAARNGAKVPVPVWRKHLASLLSTQHESGAWPYHPNGHGQYGPYPVGTMMGAANFALAEKALGDSLRADLTFYREVLEARLRMLDAVRRDGQIILGAKFSRKASFSRESPGPFPYYSLYAVEKACLFLGLKRLGKLDWYQVGARKVLAAQREDGSWGNPVRTAFALLFLLRSSAAYRPTTPSPVDTPAAPVAPVITGGDPKKPVK